LRRSNDISIAPLIWVFYSMAALLPDARSRRQLWHRDEWFQEDRSSLRTRRRPRITTLPPPPYCRRPPL